MKPTTKVVKHFLDRLPSGAALLGRAKYGAGWDCNATRDKAWFYIIINGVELKITVEEVHV